MARTAKKKPPKSTRMNFRLPGDLATWAKSYAADRNTTVTALVRDYLTQLRQETTSVEQI